MKNIYVGNLDFAATDSSVRSLFERYGAVERVHLVVSKEDGRHKELKSSLAPRTELEFIPDAANWDAFEEIEAALLASRIVQAVASAAAGRSH